MAKKDPHMSAWNTSINDLAPKRSLKEFDWFDLTNPAVWQAPESASGSLDAPDQPSRSEAKAFQRPASDQPEKF